jgi:hypothetical protein
VRLLWNYQTVSGIRVLGSSSTVRIEALTRRKGFSRTNTAEGVLSTEPAGPANHPPLTCAAPGGHRPWCRATAPMLGRSAKGLGSTGRSPSAIRR